MNIKYVKIKQNYRIFMLKWRGFTTYFIDFYVKKVYIRGRFIKGRFEQMSVLVCENISKIKRKNQIIKNFSFNFLENQVYAIIGKNDSGQRELLNLISGKEKASDGAVFLDGLLLLDNESIHNRICYIDGLTTFPDHLRIIDIFKLMSQFYPNWDTYYSYELISHFEMKHNSLFGHLNPSQKSLLIAILGLSSRAHITIFDNPVEKADLKARYDFFKFLYEHQEKYPRTFIIATSLIDEIDFLVNHLLLLDKGKLIATFSIQEMKENFRYLTGKTEVLKSLITGVKVIGVEERGKMLTVCIRQKLSKDEIRKYQKYLIKMSEVPIQKIVIYLINLREIKGIT